jgi:hypothetical protein
MNANSFKKVSLNAILVVLTEKKISAMNYFKL